MSKNMVWLLQTSQYIMSDRKGLMKPRKPFDNFKLYNLEMF